MENVAVYFCIGLGFPFALLCRRQKQNKQRDAKTIKRTPLDNMPAMKNDLILRAARGEIVERVPVWMMRQAGRYLPEFRAERLKSDFFTICRTPDLACKITLQPLQRYPHLDALIIFCDILVIPQAMGMEVLMVRGRGPVFPDPLKSPEDLKKLNMAPSVDKELGYVFDAINLTRMTANGCVPLIGFTGGPWTLMAYMIEGGGSRTLYKAKTFIYTYPEESKRLLTAITNLSIDYMVKQVQAGAQMLQVFESWAGELDPEYFHEFSGPYLKEMAKQTKLKLKALGLEPVPMTIFAKGANHALEELSRSDFDVISIDWTIDPTEAKLRVGGRVTLQGNLDPGAMYAPPKVLEAKVHRMLRKFGHQKHIANLGWGMQPWMTPEMAKTFIDAVHGCPRVD